MRKTDECENGNFVKRQRTDDNFAVNKFDGIIFHSEFNNTHIARTAYQIVNIICYILFIVIHIHASELVTHKCA